MQHDLQDIYEGQKKFFGIPEADTEYRRSVTLFEDSDVPKTDVVASVIAERPGSNRLRFSSD